jgi:hypothetical protein
MAGFFEGVDKALTNLSQSPVGMAGMGLLMMPQQSLTPINPFEYAAQGMQQGVQNRQRAQTLSALQERQRQEDEYRQMEYLMQAQEYQDRVLKAKQEEAQQQTMLDAISEVRMGMDPVQRIAFDSLPLSEKAKIIAAKYFPDTQQPTNTARNLESAGLKPGTPEYQAEMLKTIQRPQVQVNTGGKPMSVSELSGLQAPAGTLLRPGMTASQAVAAGATVRPTPPPAPPQTEEQKLAYEAKKASTQLGAKQGFAREQALKEVQRLNNALARMGPVSALTPADRAEYSSMIDAAANALAKVRGTPGAEPPAQAIDRARASLPSIEELLSAPILGNTVAAKMSALLEELGGGMPMVTSGGAQQGPPQGEQEGGWMTLPNGAQIRSKP